MKMAHFIKTTLGLLKYFILQYRLSGTLQMNITNLVFKYQDLTLIF